MTSEFDGVVRSILENRGSDIFGLCEVDLADIAHIEGLLSKVAMSHYKVLSLYKSGRSIDDLCVIYNSLKLTPVGAPVDANARDETYGTWLKAGVFVGFELIDFGVIYIGLSHWQSRGRMPARAAVRLKLGIALQATVSKIRKAIPDCPIILCGDYNDEPFDDSVVHGVGATRDVTVLKRKTKALFNPFWPLMGSQDSSTVPPGTYLSGDAVSSMLMFDYIMLSSSVLKQWVVVDRLVINDVPPVEWKKISDHYPVSIQLRRIV